MNYHNPVLLKECIVGLKINPKGIYVDATFGGGGHSKEILQNITTGKLFVFDKDIDAEANVSKDKRMVLIRNDFKFLKNYLRFYDAIPIDGLLVDLGVSSHQFDTAERGFSTRFDGELDMRMDKDALKSAVVVVNEYEEEKLKNIFRNYGELQNAGNLARTIVANRAKEKIISVSDFKNAITKCVVRGKENQFYAQVFQALRIEVNDELNSLKQLLVQSSEVLKKGGRLVIISYHSLEDRLVKSFIRTGKFEGEVEKDFYGNQILPFKAINNKPIIPTDDELKLNNRARSAKLRIAEKN